MTDESGKPLVCLEAEEGGCTGDVWDIQPRDYPGCPLPLVRCTGHHVAFLESRDHEHVREQKRQDWV